MGNCKVNLKAQTQASITKVFKASLDDMELILATIEAMIEKFPELNSNGEHDFKYVQDIYANTRKHILGVGNDEIRRLHGLIDSLDVDVKEGWEEIIFFTR